MRELRMIDFFTFKISFKALVYFMYDVIRFGGLFVSFL